MQFKFPVSTIGEHRPQYRVTFICHFTRSKITSTYFQNYLSLSYKFVTFACERRKVSEIVKMKSLRCAVSFLNFTRSKCTLNAVGNRALVAGVGLSDDKTTFMAWHPKTTVPYEQTKPIPKQVNPRSSAVIEEGSMQSAMGAFRSKHPEVARQELMRVTYTTKHRWYPRPRDRRAKQTAMDRPYL